MEGGHPSLESGVYCHALKPTQQSKKQPSLLATWNVRMKWGKLPSSFSSLNVLNDHSNTLTREV